MTTHQIEIGTKVRIRFDGGFHGLARRYYRSGWRVGTVTAHGRAGHAHGDGWATYDVTLRDGNRIDGCHPDAVRAA